MSDEKQIPLPDPTLSLDEVIEEFNRPRPYTRADGSVVMLTPYEADIEDWREEHGADPESVVTEDATVSVEVEHGQMQFEDGAVYEGVKDPVTRQVTLVKVIRQPGIPLRGTASGVVFERHFSVGDGVTIPMDHGDYVPHRDPRQARSAPVRPVNFGSDFGTRMVDAIPTENVDSLKGPSAEELADERLSQQGWQTTSRKARLMRAPDTSGFSDNTR